MSPDRTAPVVPPRTPGAGATRRVLGVILLVLLAALPYSNALRAGFVFDDLVLVVDNPVVQGSFNLGRLLEAPYWPDRYQEARLWRPATTLSLALDRLVAGPVPWWPHLVNVVLHVGVTLLWAHLVRRLTGNGVLAFVTAALFAVHPVHTEAVTWVAGRAELLSALFGLLALALAIAPRPSLPWLAPLALFVGISAKESAATIVLVLAYMAWAMRGSHRAPRVPVVLSLLASVAAYAILRAAALGTWRGPEPKSVDNPVVGSGLFERLPTALDAAGRYVALILWPGRLSVDYSAPVLTTVSGVTGYLLLGSLVVAVLVALAIRRRMSPDGWGAGFALLTFASTANVVVVIGTIFAERLLYLPSAGVFLVAAAGGIRAARRRPIGRALLVALAVVIAACAARTWARNGDYRDNFVMSEAGVRTQPKSSKMHYNLAVELDKRGRYEEALAHAVESFQLRTSGLESRELSATLLRKLGRRDRAITFLRTVVTGDPTDRRSRELLIEVLDEAGRGAEADSVIESAMVLDAAQVTWPAMAALRAQERGEWARAAALWRGVTVRDPASVHALQNLGFCLLRSGDPAAAATAYRTALERSPTSHSAANGLAWCILESNGPAEDAVRLAESAVNASPSEFYYDTLARAYLEAGDCEGALSAAERAVALHAGPGAEFDQRLREVQERCRRPE